MAVSLPFRVRRHYQSRPAQVQTESSLGTVDGGVAIPGHAQRHPSTVDLSCEGEVVDDELHVVQVYPEALEDGLACLGISLVRALALVVSSPVVRTGEWVEQTLAIYLGDVGLEIGGL